MPNNNDLENFVYPSTQFEAMPVQIVGSSTSVPRLTVTARPALDNTAVAPGIAILFNAVSRIRRLTYLKLLFDNHIVSAGTSTLVNAAVDMRFGTTTYAAGTTILSIPVLYNPAVAKQVLIIDTADFGLVIPANAIVWISLTLTAIAGTSNYVVIYAAASIDG